MGIPDLQKLSSIPNDSIAHPDFDNGVGLSVNSRIELAFFLTVFWAVLTRGKRAILTLF